MSEVDQKLDSLPELGADQKPQEEKALGRRSFLKTAAGATAGVALAAPFISNPAVAQGARWKIQSSWDAGTIGYTMFKEWCDNMQERSSGELAFQAFPAKAVAADNNALFDAVRTGVLQGMNPFTLYWSGKIPASVFLSSYPGGPDQPHQWDTMFNALGMRQMAREIYQKFGLFYVGHIHHDANIIHSKRPVNSLADFQGMRLRLPGGMVAEVFQSFDVATTSMPGSDIFPALERGTIDAADYVGPAVNWELGFAQVTDYILFGPPGVMSIYQPVDLMDLTVNMRAWNGISDAMKTLVEEQVAIYSDQHFLTIQARNVEALAQFKEAGSTVSRLSGEDMAEFRRAAIPIWFNWARKDEDAKRVFQMQLDYMMNDIVGYISPEDIAGMEL